MLRRRNLFKKVCSLTMAGAIALAVSGCGFKLAGDYDLSEYYPQVALKTDGKYRDFNEPFAQRLERSGVQIVDAGTDGVPQLDIISMEFTNTPVNADARGIADSFTINGKVQYELTFVGQQPESYVAQEGEEVKRSRQRSITASRYLNVNTEDDLEGSREAQKQREDIVDELSQSLMRVLVFKRDKVSAYQ